MEIKEPQSPHFRLFLAVSASVSVAHGYNPLCIFNYVVFLVSTSLALSLPVSLTVLVFPCHINIELTSKLI